MTYTESGIYTQTLVSSAGCDSILTINVTITICYEEMILADDLESTSMNTPVTVFVKNNDSDIPEGSVLTVPATTTIGGTITVNTDGSVTYTPAVDYIGEDTFDYTISTPDGRVDSATVTITIAMSQIVGTIELQIW